MGIESGSFADLSPGTGTFLGACVLAHGTWTGTACALTQTHKIFFAEAKHYFKFLEQRRLMEI